MDFGEAGELGKGGKGGGSLAVNKSSSKMKKGLRPTLAQPQVYKTEPSDFRSLVQQLTGTSQPTDPPPVGPKPPNSRLQRIAPPPLRPTSFQTQPCKEAPPSQPSQPSQVQLGNPKAAAGSNPAGSDAKHGASPFPLSPLSFSPLVQLSPSDQGWVNALNGSLESPGSAVIRQLAQNIADGNVATSKQESGTSASSNPPMSPTFSDLRFSSAFGLPSPNSFASSSGFEIGLGNGYGLSGGFTPSAGLAMDATFSFPERDLAMSPAMSPASTP